MPAMKACLFAGDRLVLAEGAADLPSLDEAKGWEGGQAEWFRVAGRAESVMAARLSGRWKPVPGVRAMGLRAVLPLLPEPSLSLVLTAAHLVRWRRTSRYCGVCGTATGQSPRHQAMLCPSCGHLAFPKVSPAVIVQVTQGPEILLGRSRRHPHGSYSVLAGFVDPGESLEDAVRREIEEESGIRVRDIRYFGSQPWPFPDSLMVGFTATYDRGKLQNRDDELEDVGWFTADALPPVPPPYSIARALIDDFARRNGVDPASVPTWKVGGRPR
ncbi:MAG: NAD(+) diphosphatase [Gemmatimonadetes bacterium]|nr:NAD(+) diphosphatase [Gemmatimonadota bacterium]MXX71784.1 NAD(+) diphosphatase [Gemmatimonadota bacterium]MYC91498.1 NAD(+) diphosphatase [Gemmatimonadota bacterium]MYG37297.1 NAD(+) diphosphatase [Gemmatimonadota bacterium]